MPINPSCWDDWDNHPATVAIPRLAEGTRLESPSEASLLAEMCQRWDAGERPLVEDLLQRHPELETQEEIVLRLIHEECSLRHQHRATTPREEFFRRFPQWRERLEEMLAGMPTRRNPETGTVRLPRAGESLGDFQLLAEMGRGGEGVVFLARQTVLADRAVVLKVTPCQGQEHLSLARLQHTHIVPLYGVQHDPTHNLRVLVMPYFGGTSLGHILDRLQSMPLEKRAGKHLIEALEHVEAKAALKGPVQGPWRQLLARASYLDAICWIGASLAEALDYAHQRGLIHLDVKPSNILLAGDGQPMLLDFHLARPPLHTGEPIAGFVGGTPLFMPPEQEEAMDAREENQPAPRELDGRADLFALGATLYSALGGTLPFVPGVSPALCQINRRVSPGLSDIVRRCLAQEARDRYPSGAALAADLHRHLSNQPLVGVGNRSVRERWQKWRRRSPQAAILAVMLLAVGGAALAVGLSAWNNVRAQKRQAEADLARGQLLFEEDHPAQAAQAFRHGLELAEGLPFENRLREELARQARRAETAATQKQRDTLVGELHALVDRVRFLHGADIRPAAELDSFAARCADLWRRRKQVLDLLGTADGVRRDLRDLALLHADLQVRLADPRSVTEAREQALQILDEAELLLGPGPTLWRERQRYATALGLLEVAATAAAQAKQLPMLTAWEYYALGRLLLREQRELATLPAWGGSSRGTMLLGGVSAVAADLLLERAMGLEPGAFWSSFMRGQSAYQLGRHATAVEAFSVCIGASQTQTSSTQAASLFNRSLAHAAIGNEENALRDFEHARKRDPALASRLSAVCYNLALASLAESDVSEARFHLERGLRADPTHAPTHSLLASLPFTDP
jgi:serine/threonine protein kinase